MNTRDEQLLAQLRKGDNGAFEVLYRSYFRMILHFVLNNSGSEDDANDLFQDGVVVLFEKVQDDRFELTAALKTYLYSVCRNLWLKKLTRHKKKFTRLQDFEDFLEVEDTLDEKQQQEKQLTHLEDCLQKLGDPCRTLLTQFYYLKRSMQEIAEDLGYTNAANAKNQKYKCLQRLKKMAVA